MANEFVGTGLHNRLTLCDAQGARVKFAESLVRPDAQADSRQFDEDSKPADEGTDGYGADLEIIQYGGGQEGKRAECRRQCRFVW